MVLENPAGVATRSESGVFNPDVRTHAPTHLQTIPSPQFSFDVRVDAATRAGMLDFIEWVQKEHETNRSDENPIFFGLNHFYYWLALIKRDAPAYLAIGERAVDALIQSGVILFGGFQERFADREAVIKKLEALEEKAKITVAVRKPNVAAWWREVWERASSVMRNILMIREDPPALLMGLHKRSRFM